MNVIKRNGSEVTFDKAKIENAIIKANNSVEEAVRLTPIQIDIQDPSFVSPTQQTTRFFRLSSLTTRKLSRRTPIRILL